MNIEKITEELINLQNKAIKKNEVPVAAIITHKDKIIAKAYNKVNKNNNILDHAEIIVIKKASKKLKNWRLNECNLYVTLEPCNMCKQIIKKSRINKVFYFSQQNSYSTENEIEYEYIKNSNISDLLKDFFKLKRK